MNATQITTEFINVYNRTENFYSESHSADIFGKHEFLYSKPWAAWPTIIILSLASFVGTAGNVLTLLAIASSKHVRNIESLFIVNLAISDLYVTTVADPMSIIAKLEGEHFFDSIPKLCQVIAKLCTISCVTSLLTIATMSLNRYIYVCHNRYYKTIFSKWNSVIICLSMYGVGLVLVLLNLAGIGDHSFDRKSLECIWDRMATYPYTVVYSVTLVWIPCIVIGICYLRLYSFVHMHKMKLSNHNKTAAASSPAVAMPPRPKLQLAKTFILIYAVFVTCWAPYALLIVIDYEDTFDHEIHVYLTVWAHLHPSVNWLIYYFTQRKLAKAYRQIIACTITIYIKKASPDKNLSNDEISEPNVAQQKTIKNNINTFSNNDLSKPTYPKDTVVNPDEVELSRVTTEMPEEHRNNNIYIFGKDYNKTRTGRFYTL